MNTGNKNRRKIWLIPKIPSRYAGLVMPLLLSIFMNCMVSGVSTLRSVGAIDLFIDVWPSAWLISWVIAYPTLLLVLPFVKKLTAVITLPVE